MIRSLAIHFAAVIRNYPKSDSHFAMRHRLFPALYIHVIQNRASKILAGLPTYFNSVSANTITINLAISFLGDFIIFNACLFIFRIFYDMYWAVLNNFFIMVSV